MHGIPENRNDMCKKDFSIKEVKISLHERSILCLKIERNDKVLICGGCLCQAVLNSCYVSKWKE